MDEQNVQNEENVKKEESKVEETKKEEPKTEGGKKPGKIRRWIKKHKRELITGAASFAAGAGGAIGISELGRRHQQKKAARNAYIPDNVNPLDPNI